jgi:hypothetical protein
MAQKPMVRALAGYIVEFRDVDSLIAACETVRDAGFKNWDAHTPFPVHGLSDAMGLKETRLPVVTLVCGLIGAGLGLLMQWWMNGIDYQYPISGKPFFAVPPSIPVMFEMTILFAAFGTFFGMFFANGLPRYHHPLLANERFARVTNDRFFIFIESTDPQFEETRTREFLESLGGDAVEALEDV